MATRTKKTPVIDGVKEIKGGPVVKTNCAFVRIAETGMLGANGKAVMKLGFGGRIIAPPDKPLSIAGNVLQHLLDVARWSSDEARIADLKAFKATMDQWFDAELST
ncbi:MAG: hypothetical protein KGL39_34555 [Patescibacteria group bacterium]|nr:hypothetical protein [Patescibacteria group bacterium]